MSYLQQLRTFLAVFRAGSVSLAAERLGMTQPGASNHLRMLETQLGRALFTRQARGVQATAVAEELVRAIGPHLDALEEGFNRLRSHSQQIAGPLHIAGPAEYLTARLAPVLGELMADGLEIRTHLGGKARIYGLLEQGDIDLAVTASRPTAAALDFAEIEQETLLLVAAPGWRELPTEPMALADALLTVPLIAYDEDLPLVRDYFEAVFQRRIHAHAAAVLHDLRFIKALVMAGRGYSVLPHYLCEAELAAGSLVCLYHPQQPPRNRLYLVWNRGSLRHPRMIYARDRLLSLTQGDDAQARMRSPRGS